MKKIKRYLSIIIFAAIFIACDEKEPIVHGAFSESALVYFESTSADLPVILNEDGSVTVKVLTTSVSENDRTIGIEFVEENSAFDESEIDYPAQITIPANEYEGEFTVSIDDSDEVETTAKPIQFSLVQDEDYSLDSATSVLDISVIQLCPVPDTFLVGTYQMVQISGEAPFGIGFAFGGDQIVELSVVEGSSPTRRFNYAYDSDGFASPYFMELRLSCENLLVNGTIQPGNGTLGCGDGSLGQSTPDEPGSYSLEDGDQEITVRILDFQPLSGCDPASTYEAEIMLIKQ